LEEVGKNGQVEKSEEKREKGIKERKGKEWGMR